MGNRFQRRHRPWCNAAPSPLFWQPRLEWDLRRLLFLSPVGDFHCGLRGFKRDAIAQLDLRTTGMEFASEMIVKATLHGLEISEVPTKLARDGRRPTPTPQKLA